MNIIIAICVVKTVLSVLLQRLFLVLLLLVLMGLMMVVLKHGDIIVVKVDAILISMLVLMLSCRVSAGTVIAKDRKTSLVGE